MGRLYVELFHGRTNPDQGMDDWGFQGPVLGPFEEVHVTYTNIFRLLYKNVWYLLPLLDDMVDYKHNYYGDWGIHAGRCPKHLKWREKMSETLKHLKPF